MIWCVLEVKAWNQMLGAFDHGHEMLCAVAATTSVVNNSKRKPPTSKRERAWEKSPLSLIGLDCTADKESVKSVGGKCPSRHGSAELAHTMLENQATGAKRLAALCEPSQQGDVSLVRSRTSLRGGPWARAT